MRDLFGRENYEYYARLTGRILKVEDEYIFFTYPPATLGQSGAGAVGGSGGPIAGSSRDDSDPSLACLGVSGLASKSAAALEKTGSLEIIPENCPLDPKGRLSISLDDKNVSSPSSCGSPAAAAAIVALGAATLEEDATAANLTTQTLGRSRPLTSSASPTAAALTELRRGPGRGQEVKSYTCLPQVRVA